MRLRSSLTLGFAVLATVVATTVGVATWTATERTLRVETDDSLVDTASQLRHRVLERSGVDVDGDGRVGGGDAERELGARTVLPAQTLDGRGSITALPLSSVALPVSPQDVAVAGAQAELRRFSDVRIDGTPYRMVTWGAGNGRGAIQVARDVTDNNAVLLRLSAAILVIGLLTALLAGLAGLLLARRLTRRLERLGEVTQEVARTGSFEVDVPAVGNDEVAHLGATFNDMLGELSRMRERQDRLLADAGHELRTPLTSLRTNISLLERFSDLPDAARTRVVEDLRSESRELSTLVEEVLAVARGSADASPHEPVVLADVVRAAVDRARRRSGREVTLDADDGVVLADRAALQRAVWNLVDNALKFDRGGGPVDVHVHAGTVTVEDRGPGVPDDERQAVFDRFHRGAHARAVPGSGLGLSIVADVASSHGGSASLEERPGGGTRAVLRVPVVTDATSGS